MGKKTGPKSGHSFASQLAAAFLLFCGFLFDNQEVDAQASKKAATTNSTVTRQASPRPEQASSSQITAYLNRLRQKLISAWLLPDGNNHVTITGDFTKDGLSDNLKGRSSPQNGAAEDAAMQAFNKALPLEALPGGLTNAKLTVEFSSNADPHGDSKSSINLRLDPLKTEALKSAQPN